MRSLRIPRLFPILAACCVWLPTPAADAQTTLGFDTTPDRVWIGREFWANRLQDWRIAGHRVECVEMRKNLPFRTAHLLTHALGETPGSAEISVRLGQIDPDAEPGPDAAAGLLLGAGGSHVDHRLTAQVHHVPAEDGGLYVLVARDGSVTIRRNDQPLANTPLWSINRPVTPDEVPVLAPSIATPDAPAAEALPDEYTLTVRIGRGEARSRIAASVSDAEGTILHFAIAEIEDALADGCIALAATGGSEGSPTGYWFDDLTLKGDLIRTDAARAFGPVLHAMYTRGAHGLAITAQFPPLMPMGAGDDTSTLPRAELWVDDDGWRKIEAAPIEPDSWTAHFRLPGWDTSRNIPFEIRFSEPTTGDEPLAGSYGGTFRATPDLAGREYVIGSLTCRKVYTGGLKWNSGGLWFPSTDLIGHVRAHNPDLLYFSGDQIYEGDLTPVDARNTDFVCLDYLYKFSRWCWEFGELTRDRPTITLPDDHDVYHGNLWGAGGRHAKASPGISAQDAGGYKHPPRFVNAVHRTLVSHLPAPRIEPLVGDGYTTYSTTINDAGVSFAVVSDRMFKASPTIAAPEGKYVNGWPQAEGYDARTAPTDPDVPLLGAQQERMLHDWAADWSGSAWMKVLLSQSPFAGAHTIPASAKSDGVVPGLARLAPGEYPPDDLPSPDADTNGWPQPARHRAVEAMRRGFAFHLNGDQHLATLFRHGLDDWNDAGYSFSAPAIANTWPRRWFPAEEPVRRDQGAPRYTGDYLDGFGNRITMLAAANPVLSGAEPAALYDKAPGYSIIRLDPRTREITFEAWPRWIDPTAPDAACYEGWPVTIRQGDNAGGSWEWAVNSVNTERVDRLVLTVRRPGADAPLYTIRVYDGFVPRVPDEGPWEWEYRDTSTGDVLSAERSKASRDLDRLICRDITQE